MAQHDVFHQTDRVNKRRLRAACFIRFVSVLVFIKLALTLGGLAFLSLRSSHPITLAPFETHEVRFCPSWFRGVDVVAPFPANEYVTVHKFKGRPNVTEENETYRVGYDLELKTGQFGRTHSRSYFFPAGTTFDLEFESTTPVNFFVLHPEHRKERRENHWSPRNEGHGPHHGERHHGHHREGHHGGQANNQPQTHSNYGHEAAVRKEFRITASGGRYDLIFSLPKNVTTHARVAVRIVASVKTLDISRSCPLRSSLARGHRHVRLHGHAREHVVLAASPYARTSSLVYVRLVPREHKFAAVSAILFAVYVVLRLIARYLRAHSGLQKGQGKCFWSRLCGRKNQYTAVPQQPHVQVVYPATL